MTVAEKRFCIVLLINTAVAVLYVIGNSRIRQDFLLISLDTFKKYRYSDEGDHDVSLPGSGTVVFFGGTGV